MKAREFLLKTDEQDEQIVQEYILQDLEVPEDCIESLDIVDEYVTIKLSPKKRYFNDDWYVNLQRVA